MELEGYTPALDKLSSYLFAIGLVTGKLKSLPFWVLQSILNVVSLIAYLVGYVTWFIASLFYPDHPRKRDSWYGFTEFKQQFQLSALLGTVATIMCFINPVLIIPAAWIYALSNSLWSIAEYHKRENPNRSDPLYSTAKQNYYFKYTLHITIISTITAAASTLALIFPPASFVILAASTTLCICSAIAGFYNWYKCMFGQFTPDSVVDKNLAIRQDIKHVAHSYNKLSAGLSFPLKIIPETSQNGSRTLTATKLASSLSHTKFQDDKLQSETTARHNPNCQMI